MNDGKLSKWSVISKLIMIGFLIAVLMIPTLMIGDLTNERKHRRDSAVIEVGTKWGGEQTVAGPVLIIPFISPKNGINNPNDYAFFLPEELNIKGELDPKTLKRGIYEITTYGSKLVLSGKFLRPDFKKLNISENSIIWDRAVLAVGISDMKGIKNNVELGWNGQKLAAQSGLAMEFANLTEGVSFPVSFESGANSFDYSVAVDLNGTGQINFVPLGNKTSAELSSSWPTPSFIGSFLPDDRTVDGAGFSAKWNIFQLNRAFPQSWTGFDKHVAASAFGVDLLVTVDEYQKTSRSIKYAIMVIALTFLVFFFVEVLNKTRVHPIQYILVGLALVIFFSLLLALSEFINFNLAYLASGLAVLILTTAYSHSIFKNVKLTMLLTLCLAAVYAFIFVIIQLQDLALLVGNIGLFAVLALVMFVSRKIDWYDQGSKSIDA